MNPPIHLCMLTCVLAWGTPVAAQEAGSPEPGAPSSEADAPEDDAATAPPDAEGPSGASSSEAPVAAEPEEPEVEEVLVIGKQLVADRRAKVVRAMEELGWKARRRRRNGDVVFRPPESWMGKAFLSPMGDMSFSTPVFAFDGPKSDEEVGGSYDPDAALDNDRQEGTVGITGAPIPGGKKVRKMQDQVRREILPMVREYREAIQGYYFSQQLERLPDRLDRLWLEGIGFDGAEVSSYRKRKAILLDYWATRTDTPEGRAVSRAIEAWIRNTVQPSDHPITAEEQADAEGRRLDGRRLGL